MGKNNTSAKGKKKQSAADSKYKTLFIILSVLIVIAVGVLIVINVIFDFKKEPNVDDPGSFADVIDKSDDVIDEEIQIDMLLELRGSGDLFSVLKSWATTNTENSFMRSKDVLNILLVGIDNSGKNSDVMIIASVDSKNEKITLTSVMRDSYTYMSTPAGETAAKINAAYANGGIKSLIETIEDDYKIKLDHYVSVTFSTFIEIVDTLGGITLPVKQYEMREMNRIAKNEGYEKLNEYGDEVLLDGQQALLYCRIRKCDNDGDISRTRRQRQFISALINETSNITVTQAVSIANTLRKYVKTDCSSTEIVSLATKAIKNKWYNYSVNTLTLPKEENRMDYKGNSWVWIVDYPADAIALQTEIYGETNIKLSSDRITAIDIVKKGEVGTTAP
ncbi:MAG: LCP family protein [Oscillospiraceae bacterium]|nr:LCP family protein [Oscillospiraceae bacterium]